jgi:hypothetical protein
MGMRLLTKTQPMSEQPNRIEKMKESVDAILLRSGTKPIEGEARRFNELFDGAPDLEKTIVRDYIEEALTRTLPKPQLNS